MLQIIPRLTFAKLNNKITVSNIKHSRNSFLQKKIIGISDAIYLASRIVGNIIEYTKTFTPINSVFDHVRNYEQNDSDSNTSIDLNVIDSITVEDWICRCVKLIGLNKNTLIWGMMFLDKIIKNQKEFILTETNVHKVWYICFVETQKFYEDQIFSNRDYAKVIGVEVGELWKMEISFHEIIEFDMWVDEDVFFRYARDFDKLC